MLNCGHRGLHGHGHHHQRINGWILRHHKHGDNHKTCHIWCPSTRLEHKEEQAQGDLLLRHKSDSVELFLDLLRIDHGRVIIRTGGAHRRTLSRALFSALWHSDAHSSHSAHLRHFYCSGALPIKSSDTDLPYLNATATTFTSTN